MQYTIDGLVIRSQNWGENDRLITILTDSGRVTAIAKGARSMRSKLMNLSQPFVYGNFEITEKGNYSWLRGGSINQMFYDLRNDVDKIFLSSYVCDVANELSGEQYNNSELLRLTLNTLFAIMKELRPKAQVKAVFELRAAAMSGYMPSLCCCEKCGSENMAEPYFDVMNGALICSECLSSRSAPIKRNPMTTYDEIRESTVLIPLTPASLSAVRYAVSVPAEKIFSFVLSENDDLDAFSRAGEGYLLNHLGHGFDSLDIYKSTTQL